MKIVVIGASGFIGQHLVPFLREKGHEVVPVGRDLHVPESDAVINLAGENIFAKRLTEKRKKEVLESRLAAVRAVKTKPKIFLCASAIAPSATFLRSVTEEWEEAADRTPAGRTVMMRFSVVLHPSGGAMKEMQSRGGIFGDGDQKMAWIAMEDVLAAILFCLEHPLSGPVHFVAPEITTQEHFARRLGKTRHIPSWLLRLLVGPAADEVLLRSNVAAPNELKKAGFAFSFPNIDIALDHYLSR